MRNFVTALLFLFLISGVVAIDGIKKSDQPPGIRSFIDYVPDRISVVMKSDIGPLTTHTNTKGIVQVGETECVRIFRRLAFMCFCVCLFVSNQVNTCSLKCR